MRNENVALGRVRCIRHEATILSAPPGVKAIHPLPVLNAPWVPLVPELNRRLFETGED